MSIFIIKIIACITMVLDHIKYAIPETRNFFTIYFGRMSYPLFAFLIGEGYCHTRNLKKYYKRLLICGIISQIPFMLFRTLVGEWKMLNIMFTLILGLIAVTIFDKYKNKWYIWLPSVFGIAFLGQVLRVDYSWFGVATVFILYVFRNQKILRILAFLILTILSYFVRTNGAYSVEVVLKIVFTVFPVVLLCFYNGKLGKKTKYLYYVFYPAHMLIFYAINQFL